MSSEGQEIDCRPMRELLARLALLEPLEALCLQHHVPLDWVLIGQRTQSVVRARETCCMHLRHLGLSYPEIGKLLGMDHASVMSAVKRVKRRNPPDGNAPPSPAGEAPK
jgi:chromosomal replication initiation ATPase DnaA